MEALAFFCLIAIHGPGNFTDPKWNRANAECRDLVLYAYESGPREPAPRSRVIYEAPEIFDEDADHPEIGPVFYLTKRISPFYAPGCYPGLKLRDFAECDE
jgi:hypothetical protein